MYHYGLEADDHRDEFSVSSFKNERKYFFVKHSDLSSIFSIKPKYHNHDNLLSSLTAILSVDASQKLELNVKRSHLGLLVNLLNVVENSARGFKHKIDYDEFNVKKSDAQKIEEPPSHNNNNDWDENKSYSQVSILKEYDLSSAEGDDANLDFEMEQDNCGGADHADKKDLCYLSGSEVSSSSSSVAAASAFTSIELHRRKRRQAKKEASLKEPLAIHVMRERNEEHVQLNFTLLFSLNHLGLNLFNDGKKETNLNLYKMSMQLELNKALQKVLFNLKKMEISNGSGLKNVTPETVMFTSDSRLLNKKLFRHKPNVGKNLTSTPELKVSPASKKSERSLFNFDKYLTSDLNRALFVTTFKTKLNMLRIFPLNI